MTISELIRALENIKFRNPNAPVLIHELVGGAPATSPLHFGEMDSRGIIINHDIDPLAVYDMEKPLETLVLYGSGIAQEMLY